MTPTARTKWIVGIVGIASAASLFYWMRRPPEGFLTGLAPIDATRTVFTMRANSDGPSRFWIGVVDGTSGEVVWSRELPGETYSIYARHGLTVSEQQVTVKVRDTVDSARVLAFDLATGEDRWTSEPIAFQPSEHPMEPRVVSGEQPTDDGRQLLHGDHDRVTARLVARDAATGTTQWSHELPGDGVREMVFAPQTVLLRDRGWSFLRRTDGSVTRELSRSDDGCLVDGWFVTWADDRLVRIDLADPGAVVQESPLPSAGRALACGTHAGQLVFTVARDTNAIDQGTTEMIAVAGEPPAIAWRVDLGRAEPSSWAQSRDSTGPDGTPHRGALASFVPLVLYSADADGLELGVVDVAHGRLAWKSPRRDELLHYQAFRGSGDQHFLSNGTRVVAVDGATGHVTAAIDVLHQTALAFHAVDGRLWIYSMDWHRMDELPWAVLDGRTLAVVGRGNEALQPTDVTRDVIAWLGAPAG